MDVDIKEPVIIFMLDVGLCAALFFLWVVPRFNRWSAEEKTQFEGQPKDYIHDRIFRQYAGIYFLVYVVLAFAISQVGVLRDLFADQASKSLGAEANLLLVTLGRQMLFPCLFALLMLLAVFTPFSRADQRWRSFLLQSARIPKDAMNLSQRLTSALKALDLQSPLLADVYCELQERGGSGFWAEISTGAAYSEQLTSCGRLLIKCRYLAQLNSEFALEYPGANDLQRIDSRLNEIASVMPNMLEESNALLLQNYTKELEAILNRLTEMLAKNCVKLYPDALVRNAKLEERGFNLQFTDTKDIDLYAPTLWVVAGALVVCASSVVIFLAIFDHASPRPVGKWFELSRIIGWSLGGGISYVLAVVVGLHMNEALRNKLGERNPATYLFAFLVAALGSMIFFAIAKDEFKPPHIWLAVNFGLLAIVVILSRGYESESHKQVRHRAVSLALGYGLVSGVLQVWIRIAFKAYHGEVGPFELKWSELSLPVFFMFGFVRGAAVAFLVSSVLLEFERRLRLDARRQNPRIPFDDLVQGKLAGQLHTVIVKDLSEQGASLKLRQGVNAVEGDSVVLDFPFGMMSGQVLAVHGREVRVSFNRVKDGLAGIQKLIHQQTGLPV